MPTQSTPLFAQEQFRMCRLQVFNWGTFSDLHDVPIAAPGFLFVGRSGAGKSTLLDAFSALLVPPRWIDFNAAAREADRSGRDRNLVSYVRGAWAEQKDEDSGEFATRYLRPGTTWSALALTYRTESGQTITLVQVFWLRGSANSNADVKRCHIIFERAFELRELTEFGQSNFDVRKLKQSFPDAFIRDDFRPYCERFCRTLGIESDMALKLLHKTQSAKNLGDLNTFLRDFMLDKPETFEVADRLVNEFDELNAAHQAVVTAREQVQTLIPARDRHQQMLTLRREKNQLEELDVGSDSYRERQRAELLRASLVALKVEAEGLAGESKRRQDLLENHSLALRDLEREHLELGGDQIERWEQEKATVEAQRADRLRKREDAQTACRALDWTLSDNPHGFAELVDKARQEIEGWHSRDNSVRDEQVRLAVQKKETESAFQLAIREVHALRLQPSNIPSGLLEMRREIASAIKLNEAALPFVGELLEVKPDETAWRGAIERVLRGFALSILVEERHYISLSTHINRERLSQRLVYYRTGQVESASSKSLSTASLVLKLVIKDCGNTEWLRNELRQRFDYVCADSLPAFRNADRALTREGQVKHSKTRHEKDDRHDISDRRNWVLGFNNREKLALFEEHAQQLAQEISECDQKINALVAQERNLAARAMHCQTLANLKWQEIDVLPCIDRIRVLDKHLKEAREGNTALQELATRIARQQALVAKGDQYLREVRVSHASVVEKISEREKKLEALENDPALVPLTPHQQEGLAARFAKLPVKLNLDNLDPLATSVLKALQKEIAEFERNIVDCEKSIENCFATFKRNWPMDAGDMDATLASAADFFSKLTRLEIDGLPAHEQRFFELLQNQSHQNLAALATYLNDSRKAILERMELVNESLSQVPFNQTTEQRTYLHIDASDRQLPEVREFRANIQQTLSHAWSEDREFAESRFLELRKLVERLSSQDPENRRWREAVLDVRQHVEFIGRETDESGVEVEIYRSGAGKSGGQRQKLATTCLAAALRYQLGGNERGFPMYAPVILDEAFDKADNEFTTLAMNIFKNFGFQMIVATPLKSVMTLEPFIGGACFIEISDRRHSSVLLIEYDDDRQRLRLPDRAHIEASIEAS